MTKRSQITKTDETILKNIKEQMYKNHLTQVSLAKKMGVSPQNINPYFAQRRAFGQTILKQMAKALDIPMAQLFNEIGIEEPKENSIPDTVKIPAGMETIIKEFVMDGNSVMMILIKK